MAELDIFNPQVSVIADGLEGKVIFIYGSNSTGKTFQSVRFSKPYVIAAESGLNGQAGVRFGRVTNWRGFTKIVKQFTSPSTVEKARAMYDTIIVDEVYATSLYCQDYVKSTYGNGCLTLSGDPKNGVPNLYPVYEQEYFKQINLLTGAGFTVVFIGHQTDKDGQIYPKGDKRCLSPIIDFADYTVYLKSNGVDESGKVILSSAYLAETPEFFARSRFEGTPTMIEEFTVENLTKAIQEGIEAERAKGSEVVSFKEQQKNNATEEEKVSYEELMQNIKEVGNKIAKAGHKEVVTEVIEENLGVGKTFKDITKHQVDAAGMILDDLEAKLVELGL